MTSLFRNDESKVFIISDTHFGHHKILMYVKRPFVSVEMMDETIIRRWNDTVRWEDEIFVLGDVSFLDIPKTGEVLAKLKGRKWLILGNHDAHIPAKEWVRLGFSEVVKEVIINDVFVLTHTPINLQADKINVHGHVHSPLYLSHDPVNHFCASVEFINYAPVTLKKIRREMKKRGFRGGIALPSCADE